MNFTKTKKVVAAGLSALMMIEDFAVTFDYCIIWVYREYRVAVRKSCTALGAG